VNNTGSKKGSIIK